MVECGDFRIQVAMSDDRLNEIDEEKASDVSDDEVFGGTKVRPFERIFEGWSDK
jgi:hypothetical protein